MDLVGACHIVVRGGDDRAMRILKPVQPVFEPPHGRAAQVDHVVTLGAVACADQCIHHVLVFQDHIRLRKDHLAQPVF